VARTAYPACANAPRSGTAPLAAPAAATGLEAIPPATEPAPTPEAAPAELPAIEKREFSAEERKHLCLTDPDARMMAGGRDKQVRECHSFEVAVDRGGGLLAS